MPELLEFEEPVGVLLKEIEALSMLPETEQRKQDIARLEARIASIRAELYTNLTPWQRVLVARHPSRPTTLDYIDRLFTEFVELRGDRRFADDHAIVCGMARYGDDEILVVGHQKGSDTKQKIYRNFGYARPEGYRKALRLMEMAQKFSRPIICFVDTPAAYPGIESEERGVAEAIALNLREMAVLRVPVIIGACYTTDVPYRYRMFFHTVLQPDDLKGASPEEIVTRVNAEMERLILRHPEQYFWLHDRFRDAPAI